MTTTDGIIGISQLSGPRARLSPKSTPMHIRCKLIHFCGVGGQSFKLLEGRLKRLPKLPIVSLSAFTLVKWRESGAYANSRQRFLRHLTYHIPVITVMRCSFQLYLNSHFKEKTTKSSLPSNNFIITNYLIVKVILLVWIKIKMWKKSLLRTKMISTCKI